MARTGGAGRARSGRSGRRAWRQYLLAAVVLAAGLATLALGVRSGVADQAADGSGLGGRPAVGAAMDRTGVTAAVPAPSVSTPTPSVSPSASSTPQPSPSASEGVPLSRAAAQVTFTISPAPAKAKCWDDGCWLWSAKATSTCSAAQVRVAIPADGDAPARTRTQPVGGFAAGEDRVIEIDGVGLDQTADAQPEVTCLDVDGSL